MTYRGTIRSGVIVLPADVALPEGAEVVVVPGDEPTEAARRVGRRHARSPARPGPDRLAIAEVQAILHSVLDEPPRCAVSSAHRPPRGRAMPRFTPGELRVMRLLWEHGELKPAELQDRFPEPIKNPALRSYLTTLLEKGHVSRRRVGRAYYYKAVTRARPAFRAMLDELVEAYCGGSTRALVMSLIRAERLSEAELLELKRLADAGRDAPPGGGGGRG
jgi:BlaI family transcriptional regulator, penicillinase repressor